MTREKPVEKESRQAADQTHSAAWRQIFGRQEFGVLLLLLGMALILTLFTKTFLTSTNIPNILRDFSWIAIAAFGECMIIITGGIDLSVGSVMGLSGLIVAWLYAKFNVPMPVAMAGGLATGLLVGLANGLMITKGKLPPFIATLGTLFMGRGLCYGISGGWPIRDLPDAFNNLGRGVVSIGGFDLPLPAIIMLVCAIVVSAYLTRTVWGYRIYAVGGNETAASLSGINTHRIKIMTYSLAGLLAAVGGLLMTARLGVASPTAGQGYELDVIAAAVVGGTSLSGGEGTILGALIGAAIMQVLRNGLVLIGVSAYWLQFLQGLVIVVLILLDQLRKQRR
jgi:ribose transport system permease protein